MSDEHTTEYLNDRTTSNSNQNALAYTPPKITLSKAYPVKFQKLNDSAIIPTRGTSHSAGYDLYVAEAVTLKPGETKLVSLGFATEIHPDIHGRIESRSGRAFSGLVVMTGVIDADYRGEWKVILRNMDTPVSPFNSHDFMEHRPQPRTIAAGEKIAQVVFRETINVIFQPADTLEETPRGAGGFGSTGQ